MAKLTKDEREKMSAEDFGDPKNRLFPIKDQSDVDSAVKAHVHHDDPASVKNNIKAICERKGLKVPEAWQGEGDPKSSFADDDPLAAARAAKAAKAGEEEETDEDEDEDEEKEESEESEESDEDDEDEEEEEEEDEDDEDEEEDEEADAEMSALFSLTSQDSKAQNDGMVLRKAPLIFRAGEYPDKNFSMSPEEMLVAFKTFRPVDIDLEHKPSVLDKKLGRIVKVELSRDGTEMSGEALIPAWLDKILERDNRKLSAAFDRKTKQMIGCSLVRTPRISDAHLMAAFAKYEADCEIDPANKENNPSTEGIAAGSHADPDGKPSAEDANTPAGSMGNWDKALPKAAYEVTPDDQKSDKGQEKLAAIKNEAAEVGASDEEDEKAEYRDDAALSAEENMKRREAFFSRKAARARFLRACFAGNREALKLKLIYDLAKADAVAFESNGKSKESGPQYQNQRDDGGINDGKRLNTPLPNPSDAPKPLDQMQHPRPADSGTTPDTSSIVQGQEGRGRSPYEGFSANDPEVQKLKAQVAKLQEDKIKAESIVFADQEISAKRSLPADRDSLVASYLLAAKDDLNVGGTVAFDGYSMSRVDFLKRSHLKRVPHTHLTQESVAVGNNNTAVFNQTTTSGSHSAPMSDERRKELLAHTSLGRHVLDRK